MPSPVYVQVEFEKAVDAKGNIEVWLQRLVDGMQDTIKQVIKRAVRNVYVSVQSSKRDHGGVNSRVHTRAGQA